MHNAGRFHHGLNHYQTIGDKVEMIFAGYVPGPFIVTEMLSPLLEKAGNARVLYACSTNIKHFFDPERDIDYYFIRSTGQNQKM
jgi:hypothetical protein